MSEFCKLGEIAKPKIEISITLLMRGYLIMKFGNTRFEVSALKFALVHKTMESLFFKNKNMGHPCQLV